jgi:pimeloyl-ACP methyl ester carboxylesterase
MKKLIQLIAFTALSVIFLTNCANKTKSGFAEINGTRLYFEITGEGTPLIFLHGFTCDHRNWNPQVKYFCSKYKVITYDARGHGQSAVPDTTPYSYEEDLSGLMDHLKIEKAIIIGHSMGGAPAFYYTLHKPDRVLGLVLAEGGAFLSDPAIVDTSNIPGYFNELYSAIAIARNEGLEEGKKAWLNIHPMKNAAENPISSELLKSMIDDYSGWHWLNRDPQENNPDGTIEMMESISTPTLIVAGEYSHPVLKDLVSAQSQYIPNSKLVIIKESNHMLNIENPEQFNEELESFLLENDIK